MPDIGNISPDHIPEIDLSEPKILEIKEKILTAQDVLDLAAKRFQENPEMGRDGAVVLMLDRGLDGDLYNIYQVSSDMRRMQLVALLEAAKFEQLKGVLG
jgi:hypothetical protein